jgi:exodeoxyribonuclease VII large subunit
MQPSLFSAVKWTVSSLTKYVRETLEADIRLQDVWVDGEVSNVSRPASGHIYFTLKDGGASLRCVMWKSSVARQALALQDGTAVSAHGRIGVYEAAGQYQLYVDQIRPAGEGALFQEFLRLKAALEAEGLFAPERKKPIPAFPNRLGIVTSPSGAAVKDVLDTLGRRLPLIEVVLAASQVQGAEAPSQLVQALTVLNGLRPQLDVILLVRGGGSIEDLWAFNDERVVRAVAASQVPVICGVGHETDFTLSDFAADLRAPTPTAAAELATPTTAQQLRQDIGALEVQVISAALQALRQLRDAAGAAANEMRFRSPARRIQSERQRLDDQSHRLQLGHSHWLTLKAGELLGLGERLQALSPLEVLARGYAVVTRQADGALIRSVSQAQDGIHVRVSDGGFDATVTSSRT